MEAAQEHVAGLVLIGFTVTLPVMCWLLWHREWPSLGQLRGARHRHPGHPEDCPLCRRVAGQAGCPDSGPEEDKVEPWSARKSRRGRKKELETAGVACPNPACVYVGIGDSAIHAVVGDGKRGVTDEIQYWRCQCCGRSFSSRLGTPLYGLKTPPQRVVEAMTAFAEGVDVSAAHRIFGHDGRTLSAWLAKGGRHAERLHDELHDELFQDCHCAHVQLDELATRVRTCVQRVWVWVAIDAQTKIVPAVHIGRRKKDDAMAVVHQLKDRLAAGCVPIITTDGLAAYYRAITAHFGRRIGQPGQRQEEWQVDPGLLYGQLHKIRKGRRLKYVVSKIVCGTRDQFRAAMQSLGFSGRVQTAYVERFNLYLRESVAPLSRRTWSQSQTEEGLMHHLRWSLACYHLVRPHEGLRERVGEGSRRYRARTPAMAAGISMRPWAVHDILNYRLT
jgi:IS1 family transposase/transposase-like protein